MDIVVAAIPVLLGWLAKMIRRIDRRTERVEDHDRALYGDERVPHDDGLVGTVDRLDRVVAATDGGESDE